MRITFDISSLVPKYLMADRNGRAVARAIERAFQYVAEKAERGLEIIQDVDKMPEWRLDEMAWELNCLYEYSADIEQKREWIRNAVPYYTIYGTPEIVKQYVQAMFDSLDVQEWFDYEESDGAPYHFRVLVKGAYTAEKAEWIQKAIQKSKNVRSVLDEVRIIADDREDTLHAGGPWAIHSHMTIPQYDDRYDRMRSILHTGGPMGKHVMVPVPQEEDRITFQGITRFGGPMGQTARRIIPQQEDQYELQETARTGGTLGGVAVIKLPEITEGGR